ncbi:imidazole glycerol phosphate synthase subunit hisF, partial [Vibrio parahaemolyticus V-223/04]
MLHVFWSLVQTKSLSTRQRWLTRSLLLI